MYQVQMSHLEYEKKKKNEKLNLILYFIKNALSTLLNVSYKLHSLPFPCRIFSTNTFFSKT